MLVRPTTFMNNSGIAVHELIDEYGIPVEKILIVMDDMDLPFGKLRMKLGGSSGGHRGLESVIYHLDTEDVPRLRIGIGRPEGSDEVKWVLSEFKDEKREELPGIIEEAKEAVEMWANEGIEFAMTKIN